MSRVEEGVSNFRAFQVDAREFFTEQRTRAKSDAEYRTLRDEELKAEVKAGHVMFNHKLSVGMLIVSIIAVCLSALAIFIGYRASHGAYTVNENRPAVSSIFHLPQDAITHFTGGN